MVKNVSKWFASFLTCVVFAVPCFAKPKMQILYDPRTQEACNETIPLMGEFGEAAPKHRVLNLSQEHASGFLCLCPTKVLSRESNACRRPHEVFANYEMKTVKWFKQFEDDVSMEDTSLECAREASMRLYRTSIQLGRTSADLPPDYSNSLETLYLRGFPFFECKANLLDLETSAFECECQTATHSLKKVASDEVFSWFVDGPDWNQANLECQDENTACFAAPLFNRKY